MAQKRNFSIETTRGTLNSVTGKNGKVTVKLEWKSGFGKGRPEKNWLLQVFSPLLPSLEAF